MKCVFTVSYQDRSCLFQIPSLIEVYVGNNSIQSSHDVFMLKVQLVT